MIVIFHLLLKCFNNFYNSYIKESWSNFTLSILNSENHPRAQRDAHNDIKFDPPMYKQRYERASDVLFHEQWRDKLTKVVDFGCADFGLFVFLKNKIVAKELLFVDIDELLLRDNLYKLYPLNADYLLPREQSLNVKVFCGSATYPDANLQNVDAIVALEIIEHLYPDVLDAIPYNWFSYICPKLVIVTTPNSEFNVLFKDFDKFRHYDHKFEWTREQFESWATNITLRFPRYTVQFDGIGVGPIGSENVGGCSQLAVFMRKDLICDTYVENVKSCICECEKKHSCLCECAKCIPERSYGVCTYYSYTGNKSTEFSVTVDESYKSVASIVYPQNIDMRTEEEKLFDELMYRIHTFGYRTDMFYNEDKDRVEIPLKNLLYKNGECLLSEADLRSFLLKTNYQIEECLNQQTNEVQICVIYDMDNSTPDSDAEASGYESDKYHSEDGPLSEWSDKDMATWDEVGVTESEKVLSRKDVKTKLHLEVGTANKKPQEVLIDSGYQKSPFDGSPQNLPSTNKEAIPLEYKSLNERPNKLSNILSVFENFDKINELDAIRKERKYFNFSSNLPEREVMRKICQEIARHPIAGPSREARRGKHSRKSQSSDSDDSTEEVKSITTCILENSLNKIECKENEPQRGDIIQELILDELPPEENQAAQEEPAQVVENGDLANNNRDVEGNNYAENPPPENDIDIDNIDHNNVNIDNNNEIADVVPEEPVAQEPEEFDPPPINVEVAWSSQEALFDVNSQIDMLDEFDHDASIPLVSAIVGPENYVVINDNLGANEAVLPPEDSGFPNWLLQIFEEGEVGVPEDDDDLHDEPHFYCQGDGLGVHPSTVAIDDDADDEGNGSSSDSSGSSSSSSSHGSVNFVNAENDQESVPVVEQPNQELVVLGQQMGVESQSDDDTQEDGETFQSAEGSESNLVTGSCTQ